MSLGIIILCILSIVIFFGLAEKFFRKIKVPGWAAFLLVLILVVGAITPTINFKYFSVGIGGFILPLLISLVILIIGAKRGEFIKTTAAILAIASVTVIIRILIPQDRAGLLITSTLITGFLSGILAYLITASRLGSIAACMMGIPLGDILSAVINRFFISGNFISVGQSNIFDAVVIGATLSVIILEVIELIRSAVNHEVKFPINFESGEDLHIEEGLLDKDSEFKDYFDDGMDN